MSMVTCDATPNALAGFAVYDFTDALTRSGSNAESSKIPIHFISLAVPSSHGLSAT
jgi:hypothetical protein